MSTALAHKFITVFMPTFNGEKYLAESIESITRQELPEGYNLEFLVTDSGSTDGTLEILEAYKHKLQLTKIASSEFGHGKTRQQAAERAKGEFILFLSQDATPSHYRWIINMIEPFFISNKVACVFGRQIPRPHSVPTIKREVAGVFGNLGAPDALILHRDRSLVDGSSTNLLNTFFSDVNSAVRKDFLLEIPFRDVSYAEDQALAQDMQNAGYFKAYAPQGSVWHSNEYTAKEYYHRKFDEYVGLQESVSEKFSPTLRSLLLGWIRPTMEDWSFTRRDREYNLYVKIKFSILCPAYNFYLQLGKYRAIKFLDNPDARKRHSLEERKK